MAQKEVILKIIVIITIYKINFQPITAISILLKSIESFFSDYCINFYARNIFVFQLCPKSFFCKN
ncbi:MAG: hypothetical protein CVU71_12335 [Deltaproteobacteria bacterium HGW-Deltaproteobacteria-6]|nr:MAG: hypothetical protein CVU71_12335 [Deltaproteobacteria bacterium HGW-Deltaproteobacteria-6]